MDVTLQKEAKALEQEFFEIEAAACTGMLYRVAYTVLRNDADCQDAVQDALLKAWAGRNRLRNEQYFRTWLVRILINASHDMLRKRKQTAPPNLLPEPLEAFPDLAASAAEFVTYMEYDYDGEKYQTVTVLDENWSDYAVEVHGLKNASRQIGADELTQICEETENAVNMRRLSSVHDKHEKLTAMYKGYLDLLPGYLA